MNGQFSASSWRAGAGTLHWSGDHCIDPLAVPGVLFSNWKIQGEHHSIDDVAPTILELFGLELPPNFDGKPWTLSL